MPKQKLFDDESEEEVAIKTENVYAKKYDTWREKEEIHKLEQKYGAKALNSDASISSDSEDESDAPPEISEEVEEQFLKTLALLKTKDPRIYDSDYKFFEEKQKEEVKEEKKKTLTFADSDEDDDGDIFSIEKKAEIFDEKEKQAKDMSTSKAGKDGKLKDYLTGKVEHIDDPVEKDLAPLKALWSDPKLNEGEAFLRDYILNKRYLDDGDAGEAEDKLRDDDDLEADEKMVEEQGKFERAYNFRFEEPDHEYLKRFPRTMNSIRPKDDKRSRQRTELRDRKEQEKRRKMDEIGRLKALKLKEIQEKIARIKEVTGNEELAFKDEDICGEFDPEQHDQRMRAIFDEQYYGGADDEKPVFPDLDEELEIENWDNYNPEDAVEDRDGSDAAAHCEDAEFNMDADYDPKRARANLLQEIQSTLGKKRRNRKKKSKLAKLLAADKPTYLPTEEKTYEQYMEEYYRMDCEDVVGGLPTRFKYREVVPNDYGLTVEEILLADEKELTQWVPLKRLVRLRPESVQKGEVATYRQKAADVNLKRKVLPSLFKDLPEEPELVVPKETKKKKKNKNKKAEDTVDETEENEDQHEPSNNDSSDRNGENVNEAKSNKNKKVYKNKGSENESASAGENVVSHLEPDTGEDTVKRKKKNKNKHEETANPDESKQHEKNKEDVQLNMERNGVTKGKKYKKKNILYAFEVENVPNVIPSQESTATKSIKRKAASNSQDSQIPNKKKKNKKNASSFNSMPSKKNKDFKNNNLKNKPNNVVSSDNPLSKLSDERLKAYGLNPKKYRSFLKYKKF